MVWLRLGAPIAGGPGLVPDQETRSHMPQLKIRKVMGAAAKMQCSQINQSINIKPVSKLL